VIKQRDPASRPAGNDRVHSAVKVVSSRCWRPSGSNSAGPFSS